MKLGYKDLSAVCENGFLLRFFGDSLCIARVFCRTTEYSRRKIERKNIKYLTKAIGRQTIATRKASGNPGTQKQ